MQTISNICVFLIVMAILAIPVLFIIFIIRGCMRKSKKWFGIAAAMCAASILPLVIIGTATDPETYCDHQYSIVEEVAPTCTERGKIVKECSLCEGRSTGYIAKVDHTWETDSVVSATCTNGGHTTERCAVCDDTRQIDTESALGHDMKEVSRKEATQDAAGEIVYQCSRCDEKDVKVIEKLPKPTETTPPTETNPTTETTDPPTTEHIEATEPPTTEPPTTEPPTTEPPTTEVTETTAEWKGQTVEFDGLELSFGEYSFTKVDNMFSEYDGQTVVKIPVTITNLSKEAHSLNMFYYKLFGVSGIESGSVWIYFDDCVENAGDLLPGKSYTKYFHVIYDGDGIYTILLDDMWFEKETVEIMVVKKN